ncbi:MAG: DUF1667 domain-containing protein [Bacilli bacterium]|nr:DUF1667 domain-containing protein [Bacilli bacterium]
MKREFVCIVCPRGCQLTIDDDLNVTGNTCMRGKDYAISEVTHPTRIITSSIRVSNREDTLVSVKTDKPIPKEKIFEVMEIINRASVKAPTVIGDIAIKDVLGLGVNVVITKEIK